jgi:hypothetical protein
MSDVLPVSELTQVNALNRLGLVNSDARFTGHIK